jgi:hypothetical protein
MCSEHFWLCVEALSADFDADRETVENNLNACHDYALQLPVERRAALRRKLAFLVSALARLERRLA